MATAPRHGSVRTALLVCVLAIAQGTGMAAVLCIGGRGHVEIEALSQRCGAVPARCGNAAVSAQAGNPCVGCTDVLLPGIPNWDQFHRYGDDALIALPARSASDPVPGPARAFEIDPEFSTPGRPVFTAPLRC